MTARRITNYRDSTCYFNFGSDKVEDAAFCAQLHAKMWTATMVPALKQIIVTTAENKTPSPGF